MLLETYNADIVNLKTFYIAVWSADYREHECILPLGILEICSVFLSTVP